MTGELELKSLSSTGPCRLRSSTSSGSRSSTGPIRPAAQLRQDALGEAYGVSRIPVREALFQLEAEGLVRIVPQKGAIVSELSLDEINDVFDLRGILEPRLLAQSAPALPRRISKAWTISRSALRRRSRRATSANGVSSTPILHGAVRACTPAAHEGDRRGVAADQRPLHAPAAIQYQGDGDRRKGARPSDRTCAGRERSTRPPVSRTAYRGGKGGFVGGGGRWIDGAAFLDEIANGEWRLPFAIRYSPFARLTFPRQAPSRDPADRSKSPGRSTAAAPPPSSRARRAACPRSPRSAEYPARRCG